MKNSKLRLTTAITVAFALLVGGGASLGAYAASGVSAPDASPSADATAEAQDAALATSSVVADDETTAGAKAPTVAEVEGEAPAAAETPAGEGAPKAPASQQPTPTVETQAPAAPKPTVETQAPAAPKPTESGAAVPQVAETEEPDSRVATDPAAHGGALDAGATGLEAQAAQSAVAAALPPGVRSRISVQVGGTRGVGDAVGPQAGVRLKLVTNTRVRWFISSQDRPTDTSLGTWATCVSNAQGVCTIDVPATFSVPSDQFPWIRVDSTPAGVFVIDPLRIESPSSLLPADTTGYAFQLRSADFVSGAETVYPRTSQISPDSRYGSIGSLQTSLVNPPLAAKCGLNIGLLVDLSSSLNNEQKALRTATSGFVTALTGTPSKIGVWTFGTLSPVNTSNNAHIPLTSVATAASAKTITDRVAGFTVPSTGQGTNWDAGLREIASAANNLDLVLVLTDGAPTYRLSGGAAVGSGNSTTFAEIEAAVASANAVKAKNTRIVALGIGGGFDASLPQNLQTISGTVSGSDYLTVTDYTALQKQLKDIAGAQCDGTVNVTKQVTAVQGTSGTAANGWTMSVDDAEAKKVSPASGITSGNGSATFRVADLGANGTRAITIKETQQTGYELQKQGAANAVCTRADTGANVAVTNAEPNGFTVSAIANTSVNCTIINYQIQQASVKVTKTWKVNGTTFENGSQPFGAATYVIDGGTPSGEFGTIRTGFRAGQNISLTEPAPTGTPSGCTYQGVTGNGSKTLVAGLNTFELVNSYTCVTTLTLNKKVVGGTAAPGDFTLTATPGGSVKTGNTVNVAPGKIVLSESGGPVQYRAAVKPGVTLVPNAVGSWECVDSTTGTAVAITDRDNGANGQVEVRYGNKISCTVTNEAALLVLQKFVQNGLDTTAVPADWTLTATPVPQEGAPTVPNVSTPGSTTGTSKLIASNRAYKLTESSTKHAGTYLRLSLTCSTDGVTYVAPVNDTVTVSAGQQVTCRFVNAAKPALSIQKIGWDPVAVTKDIGPKPTTRVDTSQPSPSDRIVQWTYLVTNSGAIGVDGVTVVDNRLAIDAVTCPTANLRNGTYFLEAKQSMTCWASGRLTP
ncbi:hypothetical protein D9V32_05130 [Mycetocola tolaasinivorans]|uniref:VWFA domain-containing protein n=1 Tax=Mycetocola tolaasinivorans TaxID=76635 RepID=A0A3L7AB16_9MICO|nr:hypothetical protein [Mycetocola tolaasinivorans]RLP77010.1 hypothetical protein D9V32_05130 [Mycetocola tolaasinivorans]